MFTTWLTSAGGGDDGGEVTGGKAAKLMTANGYFKEYPRDSFQLWQFGQTSDIIDGKVGNLQLCLSQPKQVFQARMRSRRMVFVLELYQTIKNEPHRNKKPQRIRSLKKCTLPTFIGLIL